MKVNVIIDTVCPWCYIGKRRLKMALSMHPQIRVKPNRRPILLNPEMPPEGNARTT